MIICLVIVAAGYALIFGAGHFAERALRTAAGLAIILSILPGLLDRISERVLSLHVSTNPTLSSWLVDAFVLLLLSGIGLFAWRARDALSRRREARERAWGTPRDRALPSAPPSDAPGLYDDYEGERR